MSLTHGETVVVYEKVSDQVLPAGTSSTIQILRKNHKILMMINGVEIKDKISVNFTEGQWAESAFLNHPPIKVDIYVYTHIYKNGLQRQFWNFFSYCILCWSIFWQSAKRKRKSAFLYHYFTVLRMLTDDSLFSVADPVQFFKPQEYILGHYLAGEPFQGCMAGRLLNRLFILLILFILSVFSSLAICIFDINFLNWS